MNRVMRSRDPGWPSDNNPRLPGKANQGVVPFGAGSSVDGRLSSERCPSRKLKASLSTTRRAPRVLSSNGGFGGPDGYTRSLTSSPYRCWSGR
jgi:hypothetical protein